MEGRTTGLCSVSLTLLFQKTHPLHYVIISLREGNIRVLTHHHFQVSFNSAGTEQVLKMHFAEWMNRSDLEGRGFPWSTLLKSRLIKLNYQPCDKFQDVQHSPRRWQMKASESLITRKGGSPTSLMSLIFNACFTPSIPHLSFHILH